MPFKSEKQRRYLWANEPEIARDWADTYGSRIQKKNGGITQGGVLNYKDSDMVTVPKDWKSSPDHPDTQLAYITKAEKDLLVKKDLHNSLKGKVNRGPGGVMSLNGWGTKDDEGKEIGGPDPDAKSGGGGGSWSPDVHSGPKGDWRKDALHTQQKADYTKDRKITKTDESGGDVSALVWDGNKYRLDTDVDADAQHIKDFVQGKLDYQAGKRPSWQNLRAGNVSTLDIRNAQKRARYIDNLIQSRKDKIISGLMKSNIPGITELMKNPEVFETLDLEQLISQVPELQSYVGDLYRKGGDFDHPPGMKLSDMRAPDFNIHDYPGVLGWFADKMSGPVTQEKLNQLMGDITTLGGTNVANTNIDELKKTYNPERWAFDNNMNYNPNTKKFEPKGGDDNYGGVPGAVPLGDMPLWQQQGFNSYEDWLATQGGGTTGGGTGGTGGTTTTQLANTGWPYKDYGTKDYQTSKTFMDLAYPGGYNFLLAKGGRVPAAFGGIMDTNTGRRGYFLGSIKKAFKGVAKAAGKVLKSPIGMAALGFAANAGWMPGGIGKDWAGKFFGKGSLNPFKAGHYSKILDKSWTTPSGLGNLINRFPGSGWGAAITGLSVLPFLGIGTKAKQDASIVSDRGGRLINPLTQEEDTPQGIRMSLNTAIEEAGDDPNKIAAINAAFPFLNLGTHLPYPTYAVKDGGRIGAQEGGLMDLGGMEKDYRNNGGFVALGGEERADDVPARLSRNEFVFTADAVRGAGGGDIDKGAEIMENVMKNLEQGGKISEETQGNTGAQEMFSVSERIGEVL